MSVALFNELDVSLKDDAPWKKFISSASQYAIDHAQIISRFGRFPHRNQILGRQSTEDELDFMSQHKGF